MLILPGAAAFSTFRLQRLHSKLGGEAAGIRSVDARFVHFADVNGSLDVQARELLDRLLEYGPRRAAVHEHGDLFLVVPRPGTHVALVQQGHRHRRTMRASPSVRRVERGIAYYVDTPAGISPRASGRIVAGRAPRPDGRDACCSRLDDAGRLFEQGAPRPLVTVDVLGGGRAALEQREPRAGLRAGPRRDRLPVRGVHGARPQSHRRRADDVRAGEQRALPPQDLQRDLDDRRRRGSRSSLFGMIRHTYERGATDDVLSAYADNAAVIRGPRARRFFPEPGTGALRRARRARAHHDEGRDAQPSDRHRAVSRARRPGSGGEIRDEGAVGCGARPKAGLVGFSVSNLRVPGLTQPWEHETTASPTASCPRCRS